MSWRYALGGEPDEHGRTSRVEIDLVPFAGGTDLTFTHADLASEASEKSHAGGLERRVGQARSTRGTRRRIGQPRFGELKMMSTRAYRCPACDAAERSPRRDGPLVVVRPIRWPRGRRPRIRAIRSRRRSSSIGRKTRRKRSRWREARPRRRSPRTPKCSCSAITATKPPSRERTGSSASSQRSWAAGFDDPEFWNPKTARAELLQRDGCANRAAAIAQAHRVGAVRSDEAGDLIERTRAAFANHTFKSPEPGALTYMLSKSGYLSDDAAGPWLPHLMFFVPHGQAAAWGAGAEGSPIIGQDGSEHRVHACCSFRCDAGRTVRRRRLRLRSTRRRSEPGRG